MPNIQINFLAIIACVFAGMTLGFLWYDPLFGKVWHREMKKDPFIKQPVLSYIFFALGNFFMAMVLANTLAVWRPSTWGLEISDPSHIKQILNCSFWTSLGFFLPLHLSRVAWEGRSWTLFGIDLSFNFFQIMVMSSILVFFR